ncbi:MAG: GNAT family N-acetyltransferase [Acidimicrobiia bacterium]|jgi:ribosomal protein S18 acetylase RimI-like enzyme|nr:GNAT family N-acetyltransferase [Acidimicrobiia bacterium]MBA3983309.1 GNAT family N-acetyltransferase [Acidimicrobiia bacterium]MDQ3390703.1 GNAT family N-acetyltransferase [Actinomycetota bacterium]
MSDDRDLSGAEVVIEAVEQVDDDLVAAFGRLTPQLSSSPAPDRSALAKLVATPGTVLFVARMDGEIVGSLTLVTFHIPTGQKAWIEDVVVDEVARGKGVGELLSRAALAEAARRGIGSVNLTSRPSRESANRLYLRIGFEARETNVYRYSF